MIPKLAPYPDNLIKWAIGSLVIHKADAKCTDMLMRVIGYTRDGLCKTVYHCPSESMLHPKKKWTNPISELLNPADFGIHMVKPNLVVDTMDKEFINEWSKTMPLDDPFVGSIVIGKLIDIDDLNTQKIIDYILKYRSRLVTERKKGGNE